jgi:Mannosyltransferase (PIG-V)
VSWDSEYYLAIANGGYEDPDISRINATFGEVSTGGGFWPFVIPTGVLTSQGISLSYAFFPFYPMMIRLLAFPLSVLGLTPIATATLAGVMISTLGTLLAMVAIYELARPELGDHGGLRAAFYLIIFPSSFFFAQVYTEGLFVGLAFASLALMQSGHLRWAALLAVLATFTRAVGIALVIPLFFTWARSGQWRDLDMEWKQLYYKGLPWKAIGMATIAAAPVLAFFIWRVSYYGMAFNKVEDEFFGRGLMSFGSTFINWADAFRALFGSNSQAAAYYWVEWGAVILGFTACIAYLRRRPELAWFGLLVVFLSFTSGPAQGMHRYILAAPPVFLFLSRLGRNVAFDRSWTVASILLMAIYTTLFSFDMWTG